QPSSAPPRLAGTEDRQGAERPPEDLSRQGLQPPLLGFRWQGRAPRAAPRPDRRHRFRRSGGSPKEPLAPLPQRGVALPPANHCVRPHPAPPSARPAKAAGADAAALSRSPGDASDHRKERVPAPSPAPQD